MRGIVYTGEDAEVTDKLGIRVVPLTIRFGDEELVDRRDLSAAEFWKRCATSPTLMRWRCCSV